MGQQPAGFSEVNRVLVHATIATPRRARDNNRQLTALGRGRPRAPSSSYSHGPSLDRVAVITRTFQPRSQCLAHRRCALSASLPESWNARMSSSKCRPFAEVVGCVRSGKRAIVGVRRRLSKRGSGSSVRSPARTARHGDVVTVSQPEPLTPAVLPKSLCQTDQDPE